MLLLSNVVSISVIARANKAGVAYVRSAYVGTAYVGTAYVGTAFAGSARAVAAALYS